jgi:hypothetical protein
MTDSIPLSPALPDILSAICQSPFFVALFDRKYRLRWSNRYAWGFVPSEILGRRTDYTIVESDRPAWLHAVRTAIDLATATTGSCGLLTPDSPIPCRITYRVGPAKVGNEIMAIVFGYDSTLESEPGLFDFVLSHTGRRIVALLLKGPARGAVIGKALGEMSRNGKQASSRLRGILANLEARHILTNGPSGYAITDRFLPYARRLINK